MKHKRYRRRNRKVYRRIELLVKSGIFLFLLGGMAIFMNKKQILLSGAHSADTSVQSASSKDIIYTDAESQNISHTISMEGLSQDGIPTGCESVSTVAVLNHAGIDINIDEFISTYLPCQGFHRQNGELYGPDPQEYFVGNPYDQYSLGCYPKVILKALNKMKNADYPGMDRLHIQNLTGVDLETLLSHYISKDIPVIFWITIGMKEPYDGMQYYLEDGSLYTWKAQEHCAVLCGYDEDSIYIMDPLSGGKSIAHPKELVEKRYEEMGKCGIAISP